MSRAFAVPRKYPSKRKTFGAFYPPPPGAPGHIDPDELPPGVMPSKPRNVPVVPGTPGSGAPGRNTRPHGAPTGPSADYLASHGLPAPSGSDEKKQYYGYTSSDKGIMSNEKVARDSLFHAGHLAGKQREHETSLVERSEDYSDMAYDRARGHFLDDRSYGESRYEKERSDALSDRQTTLDQDRSQQLGLISDKVDYARKQGMTPWEVLGIPGATSGGGSGSSGPIAGAATAARGAAEAQRQGEQQRHAQVQDETAKRQANAQMQAGAQTTSSQIAGGATRAAASMNSNAMKYQAKSNLGAQLGTAGMSLGQQYMTMKIQDRIEKRHDEKDIIKEMVKDNPGNVDKALSILDERDIGTPWNTEGLTRASVNEKAASAFSLNAKGKKTMSEIPGAKAKSDIYEDVSALSHPLSILGAVAFSPQGAAFRTGAGKVMSKLPKGFDLVGKHWGKVKKATSSKAKRKVAPEIDAALRKRMKSGKMTQADYIKMMHHMRRRQVFDSRKNFLGGR